jgi:cysteinyl-tRNA synthetase
MSKSLGNFFTLRDIFKKYSPQAVRYLFLQTHYRSPIDFTDDLLEQSENSLMRIHDFMRRLHGFDKYSRDHNDTEFEKFLEEIRKRFENGMDEDFETPQALAACFDLIKEVNKRIDNNDLSEKSKKSVLEMIMKFDSVLGIFEPVSKFELTEDQIGLIKQREDARSSKEWKKADEIRDVLLNQGIQVEDSAEGTVWKKV